MSLRMELMSHDIYVSAWHGLYLLAPRLRKMADNLMRVYFDAKLEPGGSDRR